MKIKPRKNKVRVFQTTATTNALLSLGKGWGAQARIINLGLQLMSPAEIKTAVKNTKDAIVLRLRCLCGYSVTATWPSGKKTKQWKCQHCLIEQSVDECAERARKETVLTISAPDSIQK